MKLFLIAAMVAGFCTTLYSDNAAYRAEDAHIREADSAQSHLGVKRREDYAKIVENKVNEWKKIVRDMKDNKDAAHQGNNQTKISVLEKDIQELESNLGLIKTTSTPNWEGEKQKIEARLKNMEKAYRRKAE